LLSAMQVSWQMHLIDGFGLGYARMSIGGVQ